MIRFKRSLEKPLIAFTLLLCLSNFASASPIQLSLDVIEAGKGSEQIDVRLKRVTSTLKSSFPDYQNFKLVKQVKFELVKEVAQKVDLTTDLSAEIILEKSDLEGDVYQIKIPQKKASIRVQNRRGELFFQAMLWQNKTYVLAFITK